MKSAFGLVLGLFSLTMIVGCEPEPSTQDLVEQGKLLKINNEELAELLTGRTLIGPRGEEYHGEGGAFEGSWDGTVVQGTWRIDNDMRCFDVVEWGGELCHHFYREGDEIAIMRAGKDELFRGRAVVDGNQVEK